MQMPDPSWMRFPIRDEANEIVGWEHSVLVLLPWRRYNRGALAFPVAESPSSIFLGEETRHGTELSIVRRVRASQLPPFVCGQMTGELAEAWVRMTLGVK